MSSMVNVFTVGRVLVVTVVLVVVVIPVEVEVEEVGVVVVGDVVTDVVGDVVVPRKTAAPAIIRITTIIMTIAIREMASNPCLVSISKARLVERYISVLSSTTSTLRNLENKKSKIEVRPLSSRSDFHWVNQEFSKGKCLECRSHL